MASPTYSLLLVAAFRFIVCSAGPLPNGTYNESGSKEGSCAVGDVVYSAGDEVPGASACERCSCAGGGVRCARQRCEPRPGCKAVHRPDHCCPTYQCECEQEGRMYGNGEKLVDPLDPCRVCYCQGGEVVCRRIACFVRDDCRPRLVLGRCCPEYDNCPVPGVTSSPGLAPSILNSSSVSDAESIAAASKPIESPKPEITIKEITPVSEIPVITDVKIKEILPSPSMEVAEYSSSKSPLIPREVTSEKSAPIIESNLNIDISDNKGLLSSLPVTPELLAIVEEKSAEVKKDVPAPSKTSFSTEQAADNTNILKPVVMTPMMGVPSLLNARPEPLTTKAPMLEEDDLDHNPAFPPIPDDLFLVLGNHDEESISDQNLDNEHVAMDHEVINISNLSVSTEEPIFKESPGSTNAGVTQGISSGLSTFRDVNATTQSSKENSMLNMRSVIPTEILSAPSLISDDVTGDIFDVTERSDPAESFIDSSITTEISDTVVHKFLDNEVQSHLKENVTESNNNDTFTIDPINESLEDVDSVYEPGRHINTKSSEIISRTEFSSLPIETSDQNPRDTLEKDNKDIFVVSTSDSLARPSLVTESSDSGDVYTLSKIIPSESDDQPLDNGETTEFILSSFDSHESATDDVELIKVSSDVNKSSALIDPSRERNSNVLTDLINLVGDVASISNHTAEPNAEYQTLSPTTISDSEELIPVNNAAGYKSKNKNWSMNSITEIPLKSKVAAPITKQKVVEIEDDFDTITDSPPPNDKVEPTTKPPIIDNVSDDSPENKTAVLDKKDIEIITQSYVPTFSRRPTKVIMKTNNENRTSEDLSDENLPSTQVNLESDGSSPDEATSAADIGTPDIAGAGNLRDPSTTSASTSQ